MIRTLVRIASWEPTFWRRQVQSIQQWEPPAEQQEFTVTVVIHRTPEMDDFVWKQYVKECMAVLQKAQQECDELAKKWKKDALDTF